MKASEIYNVVKSSQLCVNVIKSVRMFELQEIFRQFNIAVVVIAVIRRATILNVAVDAYSLILLHNVFHVVQTQRQTPIVFKKIAYPEIRLWYRYF